MTDAKLAPWMYERMLLIRRFEEKAAALTNSGSIGGSVHLSIGQEAVAAGVSAWLDERDRVASTHRGHGHALAKGVDVDKAMAELLGRATGLSRGKGGSMHMAAPEVGFMGTNGIVGAGSPLACGGALSAKFEGKGGIAVSYFGDGAMVQGGTLEAMNLAAALTLPVLFMLEDIGLAQATAVEFYTKNADFTGRAESLGIPWQTVDGRDAVAVSEVAREGIERIRRGEGPFFIHAKVDRFKGHFEGDGVTYVTDAARDKHLELDPLPRFRSRALDEGWFDEATATEIDERIARVIEDAVAKAEAAPIPDPAECFTDVYVGYPADQIDVA